VFFHPFFCTWVFDVFSQYKINRFVRYIDMIHLKPIDTVQSIYVIPRNGDILTPIEIELTLRDDQTNKTLKYVPDVVETRFDGNYIIIQDIFALVEGHFYDLTIKNTSDSNAIIYKDRIFATNQTIDQPTNQYYSINKDQYIEHSSENDYIVL
jgi:hypothetical protein